MYSYWIASVLLIALMFGTAPAQSFEYRQIATQLGGVGDLEVRDFDGDADRDLLVASYWPGRVYFLQHSPDDSLFRVTEYSTNGNGRQIVTGDFDNDGDIDGAYASYDDNSYVLLLNQDTNDLLSQFQSELLLDGVRGPVALLAADITGDGLTDLVGAEVRSSARIIRIFEQHEGQLVQTWLDSLPAPHAPTNFAVADLDGDGINEMFVTASSVGGLYMLKRSETGFDLTHEISNYYLTDIAVSDLDGDGQLDIIGCDLDNEVLRRWEYISSEWTLTTLPGQITNPRTVVLSDLDDDGYTDIAAAGFSDGFNPGGIYWWRQTQIGTWIQEEILDEVNFYSIVAADYDRDGDEDILGASSTSEAIYLFENIMVLPSSISGFVESATDGRPVSGVRVTAVESGARVTTDDTGHYLLNVAAGTYTLRYERECWETTSVFGIEIGEHTQATVNAVMRKGNLSVSQTSVNVFAQNELTTSYPLALRNTGDGILTLSFVTHEVTPFSNWLSTDPYVMDLSPGETDSLVILFRPDTTNESFFEYFGEIIITSTTCIDLRVIVDVTTIVLDSPNRDLVQPNRFALESPYPNPFNASVNLQFELAQAGETQLQIFDVAGRNVATVVNGNYLPGVYSVQWDGAKAATGVYFVRLSQGGKMATQKLLMIK